jgi:Malectin domain
MELILILLTMATKAIAFEQIFALNCGGKAHTDSDGIVYQPRNEKVRRYYWDVTTDTLDIRTVPNSDRPIYYSHEYTFYKDNPLIYHLPLESDGTFVLIAKLISRWGRGNCSINMKLNDIQLISNVDSFDLCGGSDNASDQYFYICVADKKLHCGNESSLVKDNQIRVEFSANSGVVIVAGLVMLKGTLGESQKLIGSATKATMLFDPLKTNSKCLAKTKENIKLQKFMEVSEQSLKNISHLNADIIISSIDSVSKANENTQVTILQEIKNIQKDECHGTNMKKIADHTKTIIKTLQSNVKQMKEMTLEGNKKFETLQADFKIFQTEQASMKLEISDVSRKLELILRLVGTNRDSFIYFDSPEIRYSEQ